MVGRYINLFQDEKYINVGVYILSRIHDILFRNMCAISIYFMDFFFQINETKLGTSMPCYVLVVNMFIQTKHRQQQTCLYMFIYIYPAMFQLQTCLYTQSLFLRVSLFISLVSSHNLLFQLPIFVFVAVFFQQLSAAKCPLCPDSSKASI